MVCPRCDSDKIVPVAGTSRKAKKGKKKYTMRCQECAYIWITTSTGATVPITKYPEPHHKKGTIYAGYARVSTPKQDLKKYEDMLYIWAAENIKSPNIQFKLFMDVGTGKNTKRRDLQELLTLVETNPKLEKVVVPRLSRLGRSVKDLSDIIDTFGIHKVKFISIKENIDTETPYGKLFFHMLSAFVEFEVETINEQIKEGRERAKREGTKSGKPMHRPKIKIDMTKALEHWTKGLSFTDIEIIPLWYSAHSPFPIQISISLSPFWYSSLRY